MALSVEVWPVGGESAASFVLLFVDLRGALRGGDCASPSSPVAVMEDSPPAPPAPPAMAGSMS